MPTHPRGGSGLKKQRGRGGMLDKQPIKVFTCIPNMGYTDPLAYDNRMVWSFRQGVREERAKWIKQLQLSVEGLEMPSAMAGRLIELTTKQPYDEAIGSNGIRYEFYFHTVGKVLTPFAREMLATQAVNSGADLIFMIDDDMVGDPDTFFRLAINVVAGPADICAALAFTRGAPYSPVLYTCEKGYDRLSHKSYFINRSVERYPKDKLVEVDAVGFGGVVFKADLCRRMATPWFMSTCGSGEDIYFCYKAKDELGARVFCDTRVKLGHIGYAPVITEETNEQHNGLAAARERDGVEMKYPLPEQPDWAVSR